MASSILERFLTFGKHHTRLNQPNYVCYAHIEGQEVHVENSNQLTTMTISGQASHCRCVVLYQIIIGSSFLRK